MPPPAAPVLVDELGAREQLLDGAQRQARQQRDDGHGDMVTERTDMILSQNPCTSGNRKL
jgi:hypothetical protein